MSYIASPPDDPIDIDGGIQYQYVIAQRGATSMSVDADADFTFSTVFGSPAMLRLTFTDATAGTPIYKTVTVRLQMPEGEVTHTPNFRILATSASRRVPTITNVRQSSIAPGAAVNMFVTTDISADSFSAENLPGTLSISSAGRVTGTAPTTGSFNVITFVATKGAYHYKRYFVLIVGTGSPAPVPPPVPPPGTSTRLFFDGDFTTAQPAGMPTFEIPFKTDPKPYAYKLPFWQFFENYSEPAFGGAGLYGGTFVGDAPGSIKSIGGGIIEFQREFALVPDTRSEYESFTYSYQLVLTGQQGGITELPLTVQSRIQFDYFKTDDPDTDIELPLAPRAIQILNIIFLLHDWLSVYQAPSGTEFLAQDATYKCWKGNIYERQQRFVRSISFNDIIEQGF